MAQKKWVTDERERHKKKGDSDREMERKGNQVREEEGKKRK